MLRFRLRADWSGILLGSGTISCCRHVVFGRVVEGMDTVVAMEAQGDQSGAPKANVVIVDCGELKTKCT